MERVRVRGQILGEHAKCRLFLGLLSKS